MLCILPFRNVYYANFDRFSQAATRVMKHLIEEFASSDLFGRDNYEFYARVTGRVLRVQGEWICSFQYPPPPGHSSQQCFPSATLEHYLLGELRIGVVLELIFY